MNEYYLTRWTKKLDVHGNLLKGQKENLPQSRKIGITGFAWLCPNLLASWSFRKRKGIQKGQRVQCQPSVTQRKLNHCSQSQSQMRNQIFSQEEKQNLRTNSSKVSLKRPDVTGNRMWKIKAKDHSYKQ